MSNTYIGIDPGLDGGIAVYTSQITNPNLVVPVAMSLPFMYAIAMPIVTHKRKRAYDLATIIDLIEKYEEPIVCVESTPFIPLKGRQGVQFSIKAIHSLAEFVGVIKGVCLAHRIMCNTVPARTWQKKLFEGKSGDTKLLSIQYCQSMYPQVGLLASERSRKPHHGMADALCIADYARRVYK